MDTSIRGLKHPDLDAGDLALEMRKATQRTLERGIAASIHEDSAQPAFLDARASTDYRAVSRLNLYPSFRASEDGQYDLKSLLQFGDKEFIDAAYLAILKREPDRAGYDNYLVALRRGALDKLDVILELMSSAEGKQKKVRVKGLGLPLFLRRMTTLPLIGYPLRLCVDLMRLPVMMRRLQRSIELTDSRTQQIAAHVNSVQARSEQDLSDLRLSINAATNALTSLNESFNESLNEQRGQIQQQFALSEEYRYVMESSFENSEARMAELNAQIAELQQRAGQLSTSHDQHAGELEDALVRIQHLRGELAVQARRLARLAEKPRPVATADSAEESPAAGAEAQPNLDGLYAALEDRFRGSRKTVKELFEFYLPYIDKLPNAELPVVDLGCGRGEWLELLRQRGVAALGADINYVALEACREHKLDVTEADAVAFLQDFSDSSLRAVTAFHLAEHLSLEKLIALLDETMRTVHAGGLVIFETPNPDNLFVGSNYFYCDPTHRHPLPSELLRFLFESRGFERVEVIKLHACAEGRFAGTDEVSSRLNELFYGPMDYAIVGWKLDR